MTFTDLDRKSGTWMKLRETINQRIDVLRRMNDNDNDPIDTAKVRGRIAELKHLINTVEPKEIPQ